VLPARVNQHVAIIRPDPDKLAPRFLRYFLVSPGMQAKLLSWAGSGGTRNALTKSMIESLDLLAPTDTTEQRAIAHILGTLDDKIDLNRRMNKTLEAMVRALFKSWFVDFGPIRAKVEGCDPRVPKYLADLFADCLVDSRSSRRFTRRLPSVHPVMPGRRRSWTTRCVRSFHARWHQKV
jgi:type I restriction enzyme S subunit